MLNLITMRVILLIHEQLKGFKMGYLREFLTQINHRDFSKFLVLWEEYCTSDQVDVEEFSQLLKAIKDSDLARYFGQVTETALPLWKTIEDPEDSYAILRLLMDVQTTNSPVLTELALESLKAKYGTDPKFNERIRLAGLRDKENFQSALAKYDLLAHMVKHNIVFHNGGWGTGEIIEVSPVREHLTIEFENVSGKKDISFANAFKTLIPLPNTHFLARRFTNPDQLEKEGKEDPLALVQLLLRDLGPKTATEIKEELCGLVIPEEDWAKWWQGARAKIKKSPFIEWPECVKDSFCLRKKELTPLDRLQEIVRKKRSISESLQTIYAFIRDTSSALKDENIKNLLRNTCEELLKEPSVSSAQQLQIDWLLEQFSDDKVTGECIKDLIRNEKDLEQIINSAEIVAFKKRILVAIREARDDWSSLFARLLLVLPQAQLRDYMLKEMLHDREAKILLEKTLKDLCDNPQRYPDAFVWYFQKVIDEEDEQLPYQTQQGKNVFFESFFILYSAIEGKSELRDLLKKMYGLISVKRFALVRRLLPGTSLEFARELLLLISKCLSLSDCDMKILRSLIEVVHPSLGSPKTQKEKLEEEDEIWTTEEGYLKTQERIRQIGTVEVVENAKEIEAARALGDLRENSEFKFAQERRARLQTDLKSLSDQLKKARVITPDDIHVTEVGVGSKVTISPEKGKEITYTILGPWDADVEKNILSFNSKFAQAMVGKKRGESFQFKDDKFKILKIVSYLNS